MSAETILVLGGTAEAATVAARLAAQRPKARVVLSLAGRTASPRLVENMETRSGGFGGAEGLAGYLEREKVGLVVDATHPFAAEISANARNATKRTGVRLLAFNRPPWSPGPRDRWLEVADEIEAAAALPANARVFLALGRQRLAAFSARADCFFLLRMVDPPATPPPLAKFETVVARASAGPDEEAALLRTRRITHLVCRNSGGKTGFAKLAAARALAVSTIMIVRPGPPPGAAFSSLEALLAAIR